MNWKSITLESGFIRQDLSLNGSKAVNYIPIDQIDSFGVVSSENKKWLYLGIIFGALTLIMGFSQQGQAALITAVASASLILTYFATRKTWLSIVSSQTKFTVEVLTTKEELDSVNSFVLEIKKSIHSSQFTHSKAA